MQPYTIRSLENSAIATDLGKLNNNNDQLASYIKEESRSHVQLLKDLLTYERRLDHTPSIWPISSSITSLFGIRRHPILGYYRKHTGVDLHARYGSRVHAAADGVVVYSGYRGGYGRVVIINHGYGLETLYAHNSRLVVNVGQLVKKGQLVSYSGSSGTSTGPHLHFEVHNNGQPVNPVTYLGN
jgi:murein DD-endopeptidase MepM/ murein hydrolase activator NlpD